MTGVNRQWRLVRRPTGMVTEGELDREGVLTTTLHSRALIVKALGAKRATSAAQGIATMKPRNSL